LDIYPERGIAVHIGRPKPELKVARIILGMHDVIRRFSLSLVSLDVLGYILFVLTRITASRTLFRYEHGVNAFDTANTYSGGLSELYLGSAIKAFNLPHEEIVVLRRPLYR
jgi:aryl-alcohol dehydrogenase-like predicted oxidoreductase